MDYFYIAYGIRVRVNFPIPELIPIDHPLDVNTFDVWIRKISQEAPVEKPAERFYWSGIGTYWVRDGREILVKPALDSPEPAVRLILLGSVFGALLHQRSHITLHASGVALPTKDNDLVAVGFMGDSRQGKSTMVAAFHAHGHRAFADDLIAIPSAALEHVSEHGDLDAVSVYPGFPTLKLWPDATAEIFGIAEANQPAPFAPYTPRHVRDVRTHFSLETLPLKRLYVLMDGPELRIEGLSRTFAVQHLLRHAYWTPELARDQKAMLLRQCVALARRVDVCHLMRPRSLSLLPEVVRYVEADIKGSNISSARPAMPL